MTPQAIGPNPIIVALDVEFGRGGSAPMIARIRTAGEFL